MKEIILTTINAKWIHPSLALRLLKANLGGLEDRCKIVEFALRQPLEEKLEPFMANVRPLILGISVSIWNHTATLEFLRELYNVWQRKPHTAAPAVHPLQAHNEADTGKYPKAGTFVVLGGPEVSHLPHDAEIFRYADYVICGEVEISFRELCEDIFAGKDSPKFIRAHEVDVSQIKSAYHLYTDEDIAKKLIYVEGSRGCIFNCEFCMSAVKPGGGSPVREFNINLFLSQMEKLINRGVKTFKFLDRTFNINIKRARQIMEFFLGKIEERIKQGNQPFVVHFEMAASLFPHAILETITRFPPGSLRLEIGIQTLNTEAAARINRLSNPAKELETLYYLRKNTHAIIHADLIAGLPGETLDSFGRGFDALREAVCGAESIATNAEIQVGILKLLPGTPIARHNNEFSMRYNPMPPYEVLETSAMNAQDVARIKNFARFWEIIINRRLIPGLGLKFKEFMELSDSLYTHFGQNWGIDKEALREQIVRRLSTRH